MYFDHSNKNIHFIQYSRKDALREQAIIPITFYSIDGPVSWMDQDSKKSNVALLSEAKNDEVRKAIFAALHTEIGEGVLLQALENFKNWLQKSHRAKMLIVVSNIEQAHFWREYLEQRGVDASIATSDEPKLASENINDFKKTGGKKFLITVAMAYEGLNVPEVSHIAVLTKIRSAPWLEQLFARATRNDYQEPFVEQRAHIFFPLDSMMVKVAEKLSTEELATVKSIDDDSTTRGSGGSSSDGDSLIIPLSSEVKYSQNFNFDTEIDWSWRASKNPKNTNVIELPVSLKQRTDALRKTIDRKTKKIAHGLGQDFRAFNSELKKKFGKPRSEMTYGELAFVNEYLDDLLAPR